MKRLPFAFSLSSERCRTSFNRCDSPPDKVLSGWPSRRYPSPTSSSTSSLSPSFCDSPIWAKNWIASLRSEEHTSELQSQSNLVCRLLLEKKKIKQTHRRAALASD